MKFYSLAQLTTVFQALSVSTALFLLLQQPIYAQLDTIALPLPEPEFIADKLYAKGLTEVGIDLSYDQASDFPADSTIEFVAAPLFELIQTLDLDIQKAFRQDVPVLRDIYEITVADSLQLLEALAQLTALPLFEYVEQIPLFTITATPDDPSFGSQWALSKVKANEAWDISTGCGQNASNCTYRTVLAVVDDGVLTTHADLADNIWINSCEIPANGLDDDGNGYVDDVQGYDVANNDNDPNPPVGATSACFSHGTYTAGIAGAVTNNALGMAGMGWNVAIMPVKCKLDGDVTWNCGRLQNPINGVAYALSAGADIVCLPFSTYGYSQTFQDLINTAPEVTFIAAAGNEGTDIPAYPAAYDGVISVGATATNDVKTAASNYGASVDIMAPGEDILSTVATAAGNEYDLKSGTSASCALVAGLASLMHCYDSTATPIFIEDCLTINADDIDGVNPTYIGQLGTGRMNASATMNCLIAAPIPQFSVVNSRLCKNNPIIFTDESLRQPNSWQWAFPGGTPATSTEQHPTVTYAEDGIYDVSLLVCNDSGCESVTKTDLITTESPWGRIPYSTKYIYTGLTTTMPIFLKGNPPFEIVLKKHLTENGETTEEWDTISGIAGYPYFLNISPTVNTTYWLWSILDDTNCQSVRHEKSDNGELLLFGDYGIKVIPKPENPLCEFTSLYGDALDNGVNAMYYDEVEETIAMVGYNPQFSKYTKNGNLITAKNYTGDHGSLRAIVPTLDGGYLMTTTQSSSNNNDRNPFLIKVDSIGNELWTKVYDTGKRNLSPLIIRSTGDTYLIASWHRVSGSVDDLYISRIDGDGNTIWSKIIQGEVDEQLTHMVSNGNGGCVLLWDGIRTGSHHYTGIGEVDIDGAAVWFQEYNYPTGSRPHPNNRQVLINSDGDYLIVGDVYSVDVTTNTQGFILKIDGTTKDLTWVREIPTTFNNGKNHYVYTSLSQDEENNYYVTGRYNGKVTALMKYSDNGDLLWAKRLSAGKGTAIQAQTINGVTGEELLVVSNVDHPNGFGAWDVMLTKERIEDLDNLDFDACASSELDIIANPANWNKYDWNPTIVDHPITIVEPNIEAVNYELLQNLLCADSCSVVQCNLTGDFVFAKDTICANDSLIVTNLSTNAVYYDWIVDDTSYIDYTTDLYTKLDNMIGEHTLTLNAFNDTCIEIITKTFYVLPIPTVDAGADTLICAGASVDLQAIGGTVHDWFPTIGLSDATIANPTCSPDTTTTYTVTVTDVNGCSAQDSVTVYVAPLPSLLDIPADTIIACTQEDSVVVELTNNSPIAEYTYTWIPTTGLSNPNIGNPTATLAESQLYEVWITSPDGCEGNQSVYVSVNEDPSCICPYALDSLELECADPGTRFCLWLNTVDLIDDDISGLNACIEYDATVMRPTGNATLGGVVLNSTATPVLPNEAQINVNTGIPGFVTTTTSYLSDHTFEAKLGQVLCVEFEFLTYLPPGTELTFKACELRESRGALLENECVDHGNVNIKSESTAKGDLMYWDDPLRPININVAESGNSYIYSTDEDCENNGDTITMDNQGYFEYPLQGATHLTVSRDIEPDDFDEATPCRFFTNTITGLDCAYLAWINNFQTTGPAATAFSGGIPNPYQLVAGDVNMNGVCDGDDITQIQRRIIGNLCEYEQAWNYDFGSGRPYNPFAPYERSYDWRFVDEFTVNGDPSFQVHSNYPNFPNQTADDGYWRDNVPSVDECLAACGDGSCCGDDETYEYRGVLLGDVNGDWNNASTYKQGKSGSNNLVFVLEDMEKLGNNRYRFTVAYKSEEPIYSIDFRMDYDETRMRVDTVGATVQGEEDKFIMLYNDVEDSELRLTSYTTQGSETATSIYYVEVTMLDGGSVIEADLGIIEGTVGTLTQATTDVTITDAWIVGTANTATLPTTLSLQSYPNPTEGLIQVDLAGLAANQAVTLNLYTVAGKLVQQLNTQQSRQTLDLSALPNGVYLLEAKQDQVLLGHTKVLKY